MHTGREPSIRHPLSSFISLPTAIALTSNLLVSLVHQGTNVGHLSGIKKHEQIVSKGHKSNKDKEQQTKPTQEFHMIT